jgi:pyrroline-5-carboxylate reductase
MRDITVADVVIVAVKPQSFEVAADEMWMHMREEQLVMSIMAGITLRALCRRLGAENVVRTMPNLGLAQGQSLTGWLAAPGARVDTAQIESILGMWGASMRLEEEAQFDAFTALAGSGPGYLFEVARTLASAAQSQGFTEAQAQRIAAHTFLGAASVVTPQTDFAVQVQRVASKGGTTRAALDVFARQGLEQTVHHAVDAAVRRSQELGS